MSKADWAAERDAIERRWSARGAAALRRKEQTWADWHWAVEDQSTVVPEGLGETPWEEREDWEWDEVAPIRRTPVALQEWGSGRDPLEEIDGAAFAEEYETAVTAAVAAEALAEARRVAAVKRVRTARRRELARREALKREALRRRPPEQIWEAPAADEDEPAPAAADGPDGDPGRPDGASWRSPNKYQGDCVVCGLTVPAGAGRFRRADGVGWAVSHPENDLACRLASEALATFRQTRGKGLPNP